MARIQLVVGDITDEHVDAIVNAANSSLLGGGGVDGAIHRVGGPEILAECRALRATVLPDGLPTGEAIATGAGRLAATWVIHTVGPVWPGPGPEEAARHARLVAAHRNSLGLAAMVGAESVAVPAISAGVYGWPIDEVAEVALTVAADAEPSAAPPLVRFVLFGDRAARAYRDAAARLGIAIDDA